jgi:plastocyanin
MTQFLVRRPIAAAFGAVLALGATGAVGQQLVAAKSVEVDIVNFAFTPKTLTVARGTAVTWDNKDEEPHNIVDVPGGGKPRVFRSQAVDGGEKFSFTFNDPGTYKYICSIHPHMEGTVVVK